MNKNILNYIEECEAWKVGIKNLHWSADNLSQHELCDDIASEISDFEDLVSEVEQSISGKIKLNGFTPKSYKITSLKSFVEDVISASQDFLKKLDGMGEKYVGIKSECETFIGTMQRKLYLVNFTLKEELKERIKAKINEGYRKEENIRTIFPGTKPSSDGGILKRLDAISSGKNGQFNSRTFDSMEDAFKFFKRNLEKVGSLEYKDTVDDMIIVSLNADNGKAYKGMIDFIEVGDGKYKANIKFSNLGKELYDELEDKEMRNESINENRQIKLSETELKQVVKEAVNNLINEYTQKQANTKGFIRSTHGHRNGYKKQATPEERAEARRGLGIPELEKVAEESIDIDPKNKGKFTATKKATGKSTEELTHSKNPLTRKRANFAKMAKRGWKPLKESDYMDDGELESQYRKNPDSMWTYGQSTVDPYTVDGLEPNQVRHAGNGNIKNDNNASWDYFDAVSNGADMKMRNRLDADYRERTNNSPFNSIRKRMDMDVAFPRQTPNERFKHDLDKQWKDTQDVEKYSRQANTRPLHRKGSLNRA